MRHIERIEGPKNVVSLLRLVLAAADGRELIVYEEAPELRGGLGAAADARDEEVVELRVEGPVVGELGELGGRVERVGGGVAGGGVRVQVRAGAGVGAAGGGGDVSGAGDYGGFVNGVC